MLKLNPYVAQLKRAETAAAAVSAGKKRKLSPTNTKKPGKKAKTVKQAARFCKDRKLENKARFVETLRCRHKTHTKTLVQHTTALAHTLSLAECTVCLCRYSRDSLRILPQQVQQG